MSIKLLTGMASADFSYRPGSIVELEPEVEQRLVETGQAEYVTTQTISEAPVQPKRNKSKKGN